MPQKPSSSPIILGSSGLLRSGFIFEDFLPELNGLQKIRVLREMLDNDPVIGGIMYAITMILRDVEWRVEPPEGADAEDPKVVEACDFAHSVFFQDMSHPFSDFIAEVLTFLGYGYCVHELCYKKRGGPDTSDPTRYSKFNDGKIGLRKIAYRPQETVWQWDYDDDGGVQGVTQMRVDGLGMNAYLPISKILLTHTFGPKNNPEGRPIVRNAYVPWRRKNAVEQAEGKTAFRSAGLALMRLPAEYMKTDADPQYKAVYTAYQNQLAKIVQDKQGGLILPSDKMPGSTGSSGDYMFDFEFVGLGERKPADMSPIIERYDKRIAASVLADFILLGQQSVGSFALSSDKTALFGRTLGAYLNMIADPLNRYVMPRIWKLNGLDPELMPLLKPGEPESRSLAELGDFLVKASTAGMPLFPDPKLENTIRDIAKLPPMDPEAAAQARAEAMTEQTQAQSEQTRTMADQMEEQGGPDQQGEDAAPETPAGTTKALVAEFVTKLAAIQADNKQNPVQRVVSRWRDRARR